MAYCPSCKKQNKSGAVLCDHCGELLPETPLEPQESSNADTIDYDHEGAPAGDEPSLSDTLDFDTQIPEQTEDVLAETIDHEVSPEESGGIEDTIDYNPKNPLLATEEEGSDGEQTVEYGVEIEEDAAEKGTVDFYPTLQSDGSVIEPQGDDGESTINVEAMPGSETTDFGTLDLEDIHEKSGGADADNQQTVVAPEEESNLEDLSQTIDIPGASEFVLTSGDNQDTLQLPDDPDSEATLQGSSEAGIELDLDEEDLLLQQDGVDTAELSDATMVGEDGGATLDLPPDATAFGGATMQMESFETNPGTGAERPSGSAGKLQRMWEGVAGSNASPMSSLQALGQQASDTIFERVATRRVADAGIEMHSAADYQIVDKLGEGAMGVVFSARQAGVERVVALKTAKPNYQKSDETRRRFLYEAQITADLGHSNIVPIYELGSSEEGMLFYSMKLVEGTPWNKVVHQKSREENLEIFMKVCDAMAFAHSKVVIHRDLKPENTMLGTFGEVFVTDWGTAINLEKDSAKITRAVVKGSKHLDVDDSSGLRPGDAVFFTDGEQLYDRLVIDHFDSQNPNRLYFKKRMTRKYEPRKGLRITKLMTMAGTPCYMAPEMAGHTLEKLGTRADIYVLGAILFEIVSGKPPHTGKSVTACLRAALNNSAIDVETNDSLLKIALKAMATEVEDRYQTVGELQDALREYRRHSESVALSNRSNKLLSEAIKNKDYETFSRTIFGYRDALDLWPENTAASEGWKTARLAFGRVALEKSDFDLVLQTIDRSVPEESELYEQAVASKKKSEERESKLKLLQRAVAAVVLFAVVGLSGLTGYAFYEKNRAELARQAADTAREAEVKAKDAAIQAKDVAVAARAKEEEAKEAAQDAQEKEKEAKEAALASQKQEEAAKIRAQAAQRRAEESAEAEKAAKIAAEMAKDAEEKAKEEAVAAAELAKRRAAQIQLGEYQSSLALAKSQIESFDIAAGKDTLDKLKSVSQDVFFNRSPAFQTWGWQRINLLSNADLPVARTDAEVVCFDFARQAKKAVFGTADGRVLLISGSENGLQIENPVSVSGVQIQAVAISPTGGEVVYSFRGAKQQGVQYLDLTTGADMPVRAAQNRSFQSLHFSEDGKHLLAGISSGIWKWDISDLWWEQERASARQPNIRGALIELSELTTEKYLLTSRFQEKTYFSLLDWSSSSFKAVSVPEELEDATLAAPTGAEGQIAIATASNGLWIGELVDGAIQNLVELESKHRAPITSLLAAHDSNRLLTASKDEPVVHVWRSINEEWNYETFLTGTSSNIAGIGLLEDRILGLDDSGSGVTWSVARQKQRRQLGRESASGSEAEYLVPAANVFAGASDSHALTLDENGILDLWSLVDGQTKPLDEQRWSYFGHTPGAELVDTVVSPEQGLVLTAARLRNANKKYLTNEKADWEFCLWDQATGNMRDRWSASNRQVMGEAVTESIDQRVSLLDGGRALLLASDKETRIVELGSQEIRFLRKDFGTNFAVSNPISPDLVMLVKRSGALRLLDLRNEESWERESLRNYQLASPTEVPLQGAWSQDGKRFYLAFSTGGVARFKFDGSALELTWASRLDAGGREDLAKVLQSFTGRVQSHLDLELQVASNGELDQVDAVARLRGARPMSRLLSLRFADSGPELLDSQAAEGIQWLHDANGKATLTMRVHDLLEVDSQRVRARTNFNNQTFVSTNSADVYALTKGQKSVVTFGRPKLLSSSGTTDAKRVLALLEGGALWQFTLENETGEWSKLSWNAPNATKIELSPDGRQVLVYRRDAVQLCELESGKVLQDLGDIITATWDRSSGQIEDLRRLVVVRRNRTLELVDGAQRRLLETGELDLSQVRVAGVHFLRETLDNDLVEPRTHLLVHVENSQSGTMHFIALDEQAALAGQSMSEPTPLPLGTRVAVSPEEAVIATGAPSGTVTIWFATPTWDPNPGQLFDLEGHRGARITSLQFSSDGKTLVSADSKNRLYAWLSTDPLVK